MGDVMKQCPFCGGRINRVESVYFCRDCLKMCKEAEGILWRVTYSENGERMMTRPVEAKEQEGHDFHSITEAAHLLGISVSTLRRKLAKGILHGTRREGRFGVGMQEIERYKQRLKEGGKG